MNPIIKQFAEANFDEACKLVKCGFELETQNINGMNYENFSTDGIENWPHNLIRFSRDQTVRGAEIKTIGGRTYGDFNRACAFLMDNPNINFEVDGHCSFHIHISLPSIKHSHGNQFQKDLYAYFIKNWEKIPTCVMKRFELQEWIDRYYKFEISPEKFKWIACRNYSVTDDDEETITTWSTWEFRFFGNVCDSHDAIVCLILSIKAMQYAYQCKYLNLSEVDFENLLLQFNTNIASYKRTPTEEEWPLINR
jgi:hypothetical protein